MEELVSLAYRIGGPITITLGLISNALAFLIFSKMSRTNNNVAFCFVLQSLCIADSLTLLCSAFFFIIVGYQLQLVDIPAICKLLNFISFFCGACSAWIEVLSSLDRAIFTICPNRFITIRKNKMFCFLAVICSVVYNMAFYSPVFFFVGVQYDNDSVAYCAQDDRAIMIYTWLDLFNTGLFPFLIMLACSLAIFIRLSKSRHHIEEANSPHMIKRKKKDLQFGLTSCGLNVFYLITYAGFGIIVVIEMNGIPVSTEYPIIYMILWYVYLLNFGGKFYIYLLVNRTFRSQFIGMVKMIVKWSINSSS